MHHSRDFQCAAFLSLNKASNVQAKLKELTKVKCQCMIDYAAKCFKTVLRFYSSNKVLAIDTNAVFLVLFNAKI